MASISSSLPLVYSVPGLKKKKMKVGKILSFHEVCKKPGLLSFRSLLSQSFSFRVCVQNLIFTLFFTSLFFKMINVCRVPSASGV